MPPPLPPLARAALLRPLSALRENTITGQSQIPLPILITGIVVFAASAVVPFANVGLRADFARRWLSGFVVGWPVAAAIGYVELPSAPRDRTHGLH